MKVRLIIGNSTDIKIKNCYDILAQKAKRENFYESKIFKELLIKKRNDSK